MKIKSTYILYVLVIVVFVLLSKVCYDCYSFKEGMTGIEYSNKMKTLLLKVYDLRMNTTYNEENTKNNLLSKTTIEHFLNANTKDNYAYKLVQELKNNEDYIISGQYKPILQSLQKSIKDTSIKIVLGVNDVQTLFKNKENMIYTIDSILELLDQYINEKKNASKKQVIITPKTQPQSTPEPQPSTTTNDNQYDTIIKQLNILKSNYDEHVNESDTRMNNILTNVNNHYQEFVSKIDDLKQNNVDTLEQSEEIAKNAAQKAIEEQREIQQKIETQEKETEQKQTETSSEIEKIHGSDFAESNTHAYNTACPSIQTIDGCDSCKPVDEEFVRKDKCRNMYCSVINPNDINSYIYSCSPVMLDAVNKVTGVCNKCSNKTIVSVPKTDEQKMFEHSQQSRNNMINNYNTRHTLENNHRDNFELQYVPNYGTGLSLFDRQNPNQGGPYTDYNLDDSNMFPQNTTFAPSFPEFL